MESHGGYLCRYEDVDVSWLELVARESLHADGQASDDVGLQVTVLGGPQIVRFAYDGAFTYGAAGARWYLTHHTLARRLSEHLRLTVHAYAYDSNELEQVIAFGNGRLVGGEGVRYEEEDADDEDYESVSKKWPLGHLARVLGVTREELIRIPRRPTALIELGRMVSPQPLWQLFPQSVREKRRIELYAS